MATTGTQIYNAALVLMDANNDSDTSEYLSKALSIINTLRGELYTYSSNYSVETAGARPVCPILLNLSDTLSLDDYICQTVMPYGLAAHLLLDENPQTANFLMQRYEQLLMDLKRGIGIPVTGSADIEDVYSSGNSYSGYYDRFSRW